MHNLDESATRELMQKVVDTVHRKQPRWYNSFLARPSLKRIADTYDQTNDFKGFLKSLAKSNTFTGMLKKRYKTKSMRGLTKSLLKDSYTGPRLKQLFFEHSTDPNMTEMVARFGSGAGLPTDMVELAQANAPKKAPRRTSQKRSRPTRSSRQLKKVGFSGFQKKSPVPTQRSVGGVQQQMPEGVDPEMMKQYEKYLNK